MTTALDTPAVRAWLDELRLALAARPADERELVLDGVRQHIEDALGAGRADDPAAVRHVLDGLGDPAAIAAESAEDPPVQQAPPVVPFLERRSGVVVTAVLVGVGGYLVPVLGWLVGVILLWNSRSWTVVDKLAGILLPFVLTAVLMAIAALLPRATGVSFFHLAVLVGLGGGTVVAGLVLLLRGRPRA